MAANPAQKPINTLKAISVACEAIEFNGDFSKMVEEIKTELTEEFATDPVDLTAETLLQARERRAQALVEVQTWLVSVVVADHFLAEFEKAVTE